MNKWTSIIITCLIVVVVFFTIFGSHGLLRLVEVHRSLAALERQNNELQSEIAELKNKSFAVKSSDYALEKNAREQLGLSKPGEIVYIFSRSDKQRQMPGAPASRRAAE